MSIVIRYQHRDAVAIPGEAAGETALRMLMPHAVERVLYASQEPPHSQLDLVRASVAYRDSYARTGLLGTADGSTGRVRSTTGARLENLDLMATMAWRSHNRARASMRPCDALEVDCVVLDEMATGVWVERLLRGLRALVVFYGKKREMADRGDLA